MTAKYPQKTINQLEGGDTDEDGLNEIDYNSQYYGKLAFVSNIVVNFPITT